MASLAIVSAGAGSCATTLDEEGLGERTFETIHERCVIRPPDGVERRGAISLKFRDGDYWIFGDTTTRAGPFASSSFGVRLAFF